MQRNHEIEEVSVLIVGAGPSGLAISACLNLHSISNIILEKEDCYASLWKKRAYDRLKLHLAKQFCQLPHMPYPENFPTFIPRLEFVKYLDDYVLHFNIRPRYNRVVTCATYDEVLQKWRVEVDNIMTDEVELYNAKFLVVATGENSKGYVPEIPGLKSFDGEILHSNQYKTGSEYTGKEVLVVGCGNSGMEIAYDLSNFGVHTSVVVRRPFHVLNKEMVYLGMVLLQFLPLGFVDVIIASLANLMYGNLTKYGIHRPVDGPFAIKAKTGRSPVIDVGTIGKIKQGFIKVTPTISWINKNNLVFENGDTHQFDTIIFATGYESTVNNWLKDFDYIFDKKGMPKNKFPNHWKGENKLYCVGFSSRGLAGISRDAQATADDINHIINKEVEEVEEVY